jgi:exonuclease SbcD
MRFIHTADIHLDSPLRGLSAYEDAPTEMLRTATRDAFGNLIAEAISEQVDFMIIAGDLYDGSWKDFNTGIFFVHQMGRLKKAGIPVYLLFGNHDAESDMTKKLALPENVHVFPSNKAETYKIEDLRVAIHGRSFKEAATTENLAVHYPAPVEGWLNIGVLHTALEGNSSHANYAPCSIVELEARGYQYWALGHVHNHQIWRGNSVIAFPGNLQGRHIRETGPKGALIVSDEEGQIESVEQLHTDVLRWYALDVDLSGTSSFDEVVWLVGKEMGRLVDSSGGSMPLAIRVTLSGQCSVHALLWGSETQLRVELIAQAASIASDRLWIEKVRVATQPKNLTSAVAGRSDAIADLQALLVTAENDETFMKELQEDLMLLIGSLPQEVCATLPQLDAIRSGDVKELIRSVVPSLIDHLSFEG